LPISPTTSYNAELLCTEINNQGGNVTEVDRWVAGGWDSHLCGLSFNNFSIEIGGGYFVKSESSVTWVFSGTAYIGQLSLALSPGWNLVSLPAGTNYTVDINVQGGSCTEIARWYAGGWDSHVIDLPFNDFVIEPGKGYFIKCDGASVFVIEIQ
jgi:hypothetical protein